MSHVRTVLGLLAMFLALVQAFVSLYALWSVDEGDSHFGACVISGIFGSASMVSLIVGLKLVRKVPQKSKG